MGGNAEKITITNDKGRLTEEEIEKMIREAEEFAEEDKLAKERIDARNAFDGYIHSMKSAVEGSGDNKGLGEKMDEDEKETIEDAIKDGQDWLSSNPEADAEEIKEKQKEIEGICSPIIQKYYQGAGAVVVTTTMRTTTMRRMTSSKPTWRGVCHTLPGCATLMRAPELREGLDAFRAESRKAGLRRWRYVQGASLSPFPALGSFAFRIRGRDEKHVLRLQSAGHFV